MNKIFIQSRDIDCGYIYSIFITREQALSALVCPIGKSVTLDREGSFIHVKQDIVLVRSGCSGGTSPLNKLDVFEQINKGLYESDEDDDIPEFEEIL